MCWVIGVQMGIAFAEVYHVRRASHAGLAVRVLLYIVLAIVRGSDRGRGRLTVPKKACKQLCQWGVGTIIHGLRRTNIDKMSKPAVPQLTHCLPSLAV